MTTRQPTTCPVCGGALKQTTITHDETWGDEVYRFEYVSAFVCTACGEAIFDFEVNEALEKMITHPQDPDRYEEVRISVFVFPKRAEGKATT